MPGYKKKKKKKKKIVWPTNKAVLGVCDQLLCANLGDRILCTLSPNHNIHGKNCVYQRWTTTHALKSKIVSEIHFSAIWRSTFTDLANSKKTQSLGKNGCREKCLDKHLIIYIFDHKKIGSLHLSGFSKNVACCTFCKFQIINLTPVRFKNQTNDTFKLLRHNCNHQQGFLKQKFDTLHHCGFKLKVPKHC